MHSALWESLCRGASSTTLRQRPPWGSRILKAISQGPGGIPISRPTRGTVRWQAACGREGGGTKGAVRPVSTAHCLWDPNSAGAWRLRGFAVQDAGS